MPDYAKLGQDLSDSSQFLIALGDEKRQKIIIELLKKHDCHGVQVTDLTEVTGLSRPAVSHQLKVLRDSGLVGFRNEGVKNFYFLRKDATEIKKMQRLLETAVKIITELEENA